MTQPLFLVVNCNFLLDIPLEHLKLHPERSYEQRVRLQVFSYLHTNIVWPWGPYIPFHFENDTTTVPSGNCHFLLDIPLEHLKLHLERHYKQKVRPQFFSYQNTNIDWPLGPLFSISRSKCHNYRSYSQIVIFYWIFRQNTSNYTQKGPINREFANRFLVISTQTLIGPRALISHFTLKMTQPLFPVVNCYFLLDIPLEHLKLHIERHYKQRVRL